MKKKYLIALFSISLVGWTLGNGLLPILPVYAAHLKADHTSTGIYLALTYAALIIGILLAGFIADRWQRRQRLLVVACFACAPSVWLMGQVAQYWTLVFATCVAWFLAGMALSMVNILAGLMAKPEQRGRVFSLLALTVAIGTLLGGATTGPIADRWGFPTLFSMLAAFAILAPVASLFLPEITVSAAIGRNQSGKGRLPRASIIFLFAVFLGSCAAFSGVLTTSVVMHSQMFKAAAISGTAAVRGACTIPLIILLGRLSDRYSRKNLLLLCFSSAIMGLLILVYSTKLWQFWFSAVFLGTFNMGTRGIGGAWITDMVPRNLIGRAQSLFNGVALAGGIVGFALTGFVLQTFGAETLLILGIGLVIAAILMLLKIHVKSVDE